MRTWKVHAIVLVTFGLGTAPLWAQLPATLGGAGTPGSAATSVAGAAPVATPAVPVAAPSGGLAAFCATLQQCCQNCKNKLCGSPFGMLLGGMFAPLSAFTGGIIQGPCTTPTQAALNAGGAEGAAAAIQQEEANAKKRRAAVRYLGTVDCHYWPEAEKNLIASLRADTNECVRWEAAMALGSGCCCTRKTIEALTLTVTGSDKDGNPSEPSERVRAAAERSLEHCLVCFKEVVKEPERPERPPASPPRPAAALPVGLRATNLQLVAAVAPPDDGMAQTVANARRAVADLKPAPQNVSSFPTGKRSLFHIWANAREPGKFVNEEPAPPRR
jgi:hypothetical protein